MNKSPFRFYLLIIILVACQNSFAQVITTIAGTGSSVFSGEGIPATAAGIEGPVGGCFDKFGNYYFVDNPANRVRKIDVAGNIHTVAGTGMPGSLGDGSPATAAQLHGPYSVQVDTAGNIYIADEFNNKVRKVSAATGIISTFAGTGTSGFSGESGPATAADIAGPASLAIDKFGNIYMATLDYRIRKIDNMGVITTVAGTGIAGFSGDGAPAISALLDLPGGLAVDDTGNVYIAEPASSNYRVRKITIATGMISTIAGNGSATYAGDGIPATAVAMKPIGVALDAANNIFIADNLNERVYKVDAATHILHSIAGNGTSGDIGDGAPATAAELSDPIGIATDMCGNVYVTTFGASSAPGTGKRIREILLKSTHPQVSIVITAHPGDTVCTGMAVTITAAVTGLGTPYLYTWLKNGVIEASSAANSHSFTPLNGDIFKCKYRYIEQCSGDTIEVLSNDLPISVVPVSVPTISVTATTPVIFGHTVTVNATVAGAGSGYYIKWYNNSVLFAITSTPVMTYVKLGGVDTITAVVISTSSVGCYDSAASAPVIVTGLPILVKDIKIAEWGVDIYPNPVHNQLTINTSGLPGTMYILTISNMQSQLLIKKVIKTGSENIALTGLSAGIYMVIVTDDNGQKKVIKIMKE